MEYKLEMELEEEVLRKIWVESLVSHSNTTIMKIREITGRARYFSLEVYVEIQILKNKMIIH